MAIPKGYRANLNTIIAAAKNGDLCIMECTDKATGKTVITLCAAERKDGQVQMTPLAKMFDGNPYEELDPPK